MKEKVLNILQKYYGYKSFRKGQENIITSILQGEDVLAIMPTGGGKSLCYQIPALCLDGITIVISPLISLMKDQVDSLVTMGINACYINSSLSSEDYNNILQGIIICSTRTIRKCWIFKYNKIKRNITNRNRRGTLYISMGSWF